MDSFVDLKTAEAHFRLQRRGTDTPAVVFIHGFGGDLACWDRVWELLPADFPALRYDLRGFGQSAANMGGEFSHTDDLAAILEHLGIERCHLVGASMGGAIAVNFALNFPDRADRLALISPALVAWEWSENWKELWRPIVAEARCGNMDGARQLWWQHPLFASTRESPAASELRDSILRFDGQQWIQDYQRPELPDVERLHQLESPVLLLSGAHDLEDFRLIADLLAAAVPHLARVEFPAGGHCLHLEDPAGIVRHLLSYLESEL